MKESNWLELFFETRQDILEDAFLLDALSMYVLSNGEFNRGERADYFPQVFQRLCNYLSQHVLELHRLAEQIGPDPLP